MLGALSARATPARAQPLGSAVPTVDRLAVRVVTDSYFLAFAQNQKLAGIEVQRLRPPPRSDPPRKTLVSEFGLAWHVESWRGSDSRQILLDFGYTPETLNNNLDFLGVQADKLDALMLTHGHFDHFGGMAGFLARNKGRLRSGLPFYVGGEEAFCWRQNLIGAAPSNFGAIDRAAIEDAKVQIVFSDQPSIVADHGFATGLLPTASFEKVFAPTQMTVSVKEGLGCFPERVAEAKRNATDRYIADDFAHEIALAFNIKDRGLVVLSSCSHRGIINAVRRAQEISGINKVHAVLGGFHLAPHPAEYVQQTVAALKELNPDMVAPMHCTGETFMDIGARELPGRLVRSYTGTRYLFGA
jgi:7,8-dihydropterin-6-yl-methyl-4-(beta-D-ribofuranosyl)aminobenzene 5'-phosphate synthase